MESVRESNISSVFLAVYRHEGAGAETVASAPEEIGVLYAPGGSLSVENEGNERTLEANHAMRYRGRLRIRGSTARPLRWSLSSGSANSPLLVQRLETFTCPFLLRCDRVDFPLGGVAYTHTHRGPGIRVLLAGELLVTTAGRTVAMQPGEAWFESGPEPVFAQASDRALTSFVRVMILPPEIVGKGSIRYVNPADEKKPKTQRYTVFVDEVFAA